jgi:hypothetical protein
MTSTSASFLNAMIGMLPAGWTEKGAVSLPTSQPLHMKQQIGARTDLFFKSVRGLGDDSLKDYLDKAWAEDPLDTLRIIFHTRDCRGGKGERKLFRDMLTWLAQKCPQAIAYNLHLVPLYGRWDDVLFVPGGIDLMARQLLKDHAAFTENPETAQISLAAKWAPSERHALDKKYQFVSQLVKALKMPDDAVKGITQGRTVYRKKYLTPLRTYLKVVERAMCAKEWETIDYSKVPSKAMKNYKKAFERNDEDRFTEWKTALARPDKMTEDGEVVKVNAKQLFPHELVKEYYSGQPQNVVTEEQWKVLQEDLAQAGTFSRSVCLCDVSGSMEGDPMLVSIALGVLLSAVTQPPFQNQVITFESNPQFHLVEGKTLFDKVQSLKNMKWGGSTNLQSAFDLILSRAIQFKVPADEMPQRLYIFSDMQFDSACGRNDHTNFETITAKYRAAGYTRPEIVFWNLRATNSKEVPVSANENGVALLSGFSPSLLKSLLDGADLTPWGIIRKILDNPRYSAITLPEDNKSDEKKHGFSEDDDVPDMLMDVSPSDHVLMAPVARDKAPSASRGGQSRGGRGGARGRGRGRGARSRGRGRGGS